MIRILDLTTREVHTIQATKNGENLLQCPVCSPTRRKKHDRCMSWNADKGIGQCHHCGASFVKYNPFSQQPKKEYAVPQWRNKTELTDKAVKWFEGRMISQDVLRRMRIFSDEEYMPQFGREVEVICTPYFRDGQQVNIKFRGPGKSFKMVKDAELVLYNLDCLAAGPKELIIVEGELDALSWIEAGFQNVVSVPNGASGTDMSYLDSVIDLLEKVDTFYIATDHDEPGVRLRDELMRRLGADRCRIVTYQGCKDTNELLISGGGPSLRRAYEQAISPPIRGVLDLQTCYDDVRLVFENGLETGKKIGIEPLDDIISWKTGLLAVWTGIPSHGKSEFLNFMAVNWCVRYGWKTAFFSPENMPYSKHLVPKLASVIIGHNFRKGFITEDEFEQVFDYISDHFKMIDAGDDYTVETVLTAAENLVRRSGIKVLVIDPFNCFEHTRNRGESETEYIGRFLDSLTRFAKRHDVLVNLVAHPRKMERLTGGNAYQAPSLYDISGSANFYNKADIGLTVYRRFNDHTKGPATELNVTKVRFKELGQTGVCELQYNFRNGRYSQPVDDVNLLDNRNYLITAQSHDPGGTTLNFGAENDEYPF